jgi:hypothetical protein
MTTKDSPLSDLKVQADKIAILLRAAERGANISSYDPSGRITAARNYRPRPGMILGSCEKVEGTNSIDARGWCRFYYPDED